MNPNASSTLGTRSPRGFVPRVVFCVGAYGLDSSILLGSTLSTNATHHRGRGERCSIEKTPDPRLRCMRWFPDFTSRHLVSASRVACSVHQFADHTVHSQKSPSRRLID